VKNDNFRLEIEDVEFDCSKFLVFSQREGGRVGEERLMCKGRVQQAGIEPTSSFIYILPARHLQTPVRERTAEGFQHRC
jgi:hypothetical protein